MYFCRLINLKYENYSKQSQKMMATIKIEVSETDYSEKVKDVLKRYRKDAVIPGFRKRKNSNVNN